MKSYGVTIQMKSLQLWVLLYETTCSSVVNEIRLGIFYVVLFEETLESDIIDDLATQRKFV